MIFWCIIISYFTVAIFIYLRTMYAVNKLSGGDFTEAVCFVGESEFVDEMETKLERTMSLESFLWLALLITCLIWPYTYVYKPIKRHFTK